MRGSVFIGLAAASLLAACAMAGPRPLIPLWKDFSDHPKGYLGAAAPRSVEFIAPPPAADSPRGQADTAVYRRTRALQGSPRWTLAASDADVETPNAPGKVFGCTLNAALTIETQPVLMRLLARVMGDVDTAVKGPKEHYNRPRPFLSDNGQICVAKEDWLVNQASYPSGHAGVGMAWALILAEMEPAKAEAITLRGLQYGESRVVCGVHYASDVDAGRLAGAAVVSKLRTDPLFEADYRIAKAELDRAISAGRRPEPGKCAAESQSLAVRPF